MLALLPFVLLLLAYVIGSEMRLAENPNDKLLPSFADHGRGDLRLCLPARPAHRQLSAVVRHGGEPDRLLIGLAISTVDRAGLGIVIGLLPDRGRTFAPFVAVLSMVPPLALLPILFIVMGLGEASKIALIVIGTTLKLIRDLALARRATCRASRSSRRRRSAPPPGRSPARGAAADPAAAHRCLRLQIGPAWLFLIAAEAIAADTGLGYRIFLVRRYLSMDVIFPYVAGSRCSPSSWTSRLRLLQRKAFPWFAQARAA